MKESIKPILLKQINNYGYPIPNDETNPIPPNFNIQDPAVVLRLRAELASLMDRNHSQGLEADYFVIDVILPILNTCLDSLNKLQRLEQLVKMLVGEDRFDGYMKMLGYEQDGEP